MKEGTGRESDGHRWRENAQNRQPPFYHRARAATLSAVPEVAPFFDTSLSHFRTANEHFLRFSLPIFFLLCSRRQARFRSRRRECTPTTRRDSLFPIQKHGGKRLLKAILDMPERNNSHVLSVCSELGIF